MPNAPAALLLGTLSCALAGCCAFVPCHPATALAGKVVTANGEPISSARLTLYGTSFATNSKGCFKLRVSDALPFIFVANAEGYKPVEVQAQRGFYRAAVKLVPVESAEVSQTEWLAIPQSEYDAFSCS